MGRNHSFPDRADVVIVGVGGIVGASLAHFLAEFGVRDIVGIEQAGVMLKALLLMLVIFSGQQ